MDAEADAPLLPLSPVSPMSPGAGQRTIQLHRGSGDGKGPPWMGERGAQVAALATAGTQRLRLPKRRAQSAGRSSTSSGTAVDGIPEDRIADGRIADGRITDGRVPEDGVSIQVGHVRGTRSLSAARGIALSVSGRGAAGQRLSQGAQAGPASPPLPIAGRRRFNSAMSAFRGEGGGTELTIRLSVDASQSRSYRMLLAGDSVLADLRELEDEHQGAVAGAALGGRLVALYFAAAWSADCDDFTAQLRGVAAAHGDDLAVVLVSLDHHPADMARMMAGTGWLGVPWREHARRRALAERMHVSATDLPHLVVLDGHTHHVVSAAARSELERRPLTCVREWKKSRAGLSWWRRAQPW